MGRCKRTNCRYRMRKEVVFANCDYFGKTGKTRRSQIFKRYGFTKWTKEAVFQMDPANCPLYEPTNPQSCGNWTPEERVRLQELYDQGLNDVEIGAEMDVTPERVGRWRRAQGFQWNKLVDYKLIAELYQQGLTDKQIGERAGCSEDSAGSWRRERGLPSNGPGRHWKKKGDTDG